LKILILSALLTNPEKKEVFARRINARLNSETSTNFSYLPLLC